MKVIKWLDNYLEKSICAVLLSSMTIIITLQLILRWTGLPLDWTEEIARYCFVWLIYIACSYGVKERAHIKVDAVMLLFRGKGKFIVQVVSNVLFAIFAAVITYQGVLLLIKMGSSGQVSPAVQIPMVVPYSSYTIGFIMVLIRLVQDTLLLFKEEKKRVSGKKEDKE
ncbi:MAG: TRAP transporter small permease [Sedimentibacter sp.]|uniref:TRAP transporter small permease n=1 Tax=Sedimentibacter sp. TaxID=1960295 RepID=UPI0031590C6E